MIRRVGFAVGVLLLAAFCTFPVLWQAVTSVKPDAELTALPPLLPRTPTAAHYRAVLSTPAFARALANSAVVAASTTAIGLGLGALAAFALAKLRVRLRGAFLAFVLSATMFPPIATVSPLFLIIRGAGLRDSLVALVVTYTTFSLPLAIWILTRFFDEVPDELYQAARVDGCTPLQAFARIVLPLAGPGLFTTAILVFIAAWNEFLFALTFTSTFRSRTVPVAIALFPGEREVPWGDLSAASLVATLPLVLLVFAFQRRIVEGLTAGAVKG